jgi:hypothetical protein
MIDVAVFAEHSDSRKPMIAGWNARIFNRTEVHEGSGIHLDKTGGVIRLGPGIYHICGSSAITYNDLFTGPTQGWGTEQRPNGGYCRLRYKKDAGSKNEKAIVVGTISNANMVPSIIDTYLKVPKIAEVVLEHQAGDQVGGIYLQDNSANSSWHVFARIAIRKV